MTDTKARQQSIGFCRFLFIISLCFVGCVVRSLAFEVSSTSSQLRRPWRGFPLGATTNIDHQKRKMASSTARNDHDSSTNPNESSLPNWRSMPKPAKQPQEGVNPNWSNLLRERPSWSNKHFQESLELYHKFMACTDSYVAPGIQNALNTLDHAYRLYGPQSVVGSFNGGKDAVVILHLMRAAHAKHYHDLIEDCDDEKDAPEILRPRVVYFDHADEFPQVLDFLTQSVAQYDLDMLAFEKGTKFSTGLEILVKHNHLVSDDASRPPWPMAFVLGTRSNDPNAGGQDAFAPSSHYMPPFMRVNPILDWTYGHVWHFLRVYQLPYCSLYDEGYTSLGTTKDTLPCPALLVPVGNETNTATSTAMNLPKYWPAYMLRDWDQERAGRIKKEKPKALKKKSPIPSSVSTISDIRKSDDVAPMPSTTQPSSESGFIAAFSQMNASSGGNSQHQQPLMVGDDSTNFTMDSLDETAQKTVGILIIGDEILKGQTKDLNTHVAATALRKQNVLLSRVVVVSDDPELIIQEIQRMQSEVDVIITSGGVGPTHDDVTIKSVAAALNREMVLHEEMAQLLIDKMGPAQSKSTSTNNASPASINSQLSDAQLKMATLPANSKLRYLSKDDSEWPVLQCRNIFVLPGVPEFFSKKIENVAVYLSSQLERSIGFKVVLSVDEASIVDALNDTVQRHPNVSFGSYPFVSHPEFKTVVTLEGSLTVDAVAKPNEVEAEPLSLSRASRNSTVFFPGDIRSSKEQRDRYVRLALEDLIRRLPEGSILRVDNDDLTPFN